MNLFLTLLICYVVGGIIVSAFFAIRQLLQELITGRYDRKFGPSWNSPAFWLVIGTMACPIVNFMWIRAMYYTLKEKLK